MPPKCCHGVRLCNSSLYSSGEPLPNLNLAFKWILRFETLTLSWTWKFDFEVAFWYLEGASAVSHGAEGEARQN